MWIGLGIVIGVAIGWHLPQPQYAKDLESRFVAWLRSKV